MIAFFMFSRKAYKSTDLMIKIKSGNLTVTIVSYQRKNSDQQFLTYP